MNLYVKVCLLLGMFCHVIAAYCYAYMASSMGLLPIIHYPLRPYALPFFILGISLLVFGFVLHKFYSEAK